MQDFPTSDMALAAPPSPAAPLDEDLPEMAVQAYALADRHCSHCQNFHAIWPYRRLARMCGADAGLKEIERELGALIASGGKRVLIAAAADTNLLATVARASGGRKIEITVVDKCGTPIELCRRYARRWDLSVDACVADLTELDVRGFDIVYVNSVLQFIPAERRIDALTRLRRALDPGGHLVMAFNTSARVAGGPQPDLRGGYADWVIAELDRQNIPLPESRERFRERMQDSTRAYAGREGTFESPGELDEMVQAAGFVVKSREEVDLPLTGPMQNFAAKHSKQRFVMVAQSPVS